MTELLIFTGVMAGFAIYDVQKMREKKLKREIVVYFVICAAALTLAVIFIPGLQSRSIMSYLLQLLGIKA